MKLNDKSTITKKEYEPTNEDLKTRLDEFCEEAGVYMLRSESSEILGGEVERIPLVFRHKDNNWEGHETRSPILYYLSSKGHITSSAAYILGMSKVLGEPNIVYVAEQFDSLKEVASDCELTAQWHPMEEMAAAGAVGLGITDGTVVSMDSLEELASLYLKKGDSR